MSTAPRNPAPATQAPTNFEQVYERQFTALEISGTLAPLIKALPDADGNVHFVFLTSAPSLDIASLPPDHDLIANPFGAHPGQYLIQLAVERVEDGLFEPAAGGQAAALVAAEAGDVKAGQVDI